MVSRAFPYMITKGSVESGKFDSEPTIYFGKCASNLGKAFDASNVFLVLPCTFLGCDHKVLVPKEDSEVVKRAKQVYCTCCVSRYIRQERI